LVEAPLQHGYLPRMRSRLLGAFACGLLSAAIAAQVEKQQAPGKPAPAVTALGEVDVHHVVLDDRVQTVIDAFYASKVRRSGATSHLVLVRCTGTNVLMIDINMREMIMNGTMANNFQLADGDLLLVPHVDAVRTAKKDFEVVEEVVRTTAPTDWSPAQHARLAVGLLLCTKDAARRHGYLVEFGKLAADGAVAVPALANALGGDVAIARDAATALGMIGAAAAPALPALTKGAAGDDAQLRERCKAAMRAIEAAASKKLDAPPK
jgi:hypothetical protein